MRPLTKRHPDLAGYKALIKSLHRLDDRALGEDILTQLREIKSAVAGVRGASSLKDPAFAAKVLALIHALYTSRRFSTQEYVYYAAYAVEMVHDGRWIAGAYGGELDPLSEAMDRIRRAHGLKQDEFWPISKGPEEHVALSKRYETILDGKLAECFIDLDLHDLAKLRKSDLAEFNRLYERGRRTAFHSEELVPAIRDLVIRNEEDARRAASVKAYSAAVISLGAGIEGLLLLRCLRSKKKASHVARKLPKRLRPQRPDDPTTWRFETLIQTCFEASWLRPIETRLGRYDTAGLAHILREMRNYVHPGRQAKERPWLETELRDYEDAKAIYVVLLSTLGADTRKTPAPAPPNKSPQRTALAGSRRR